MEIYRAIKKGKLMPRASETPVELQEGDIVKHNGEYVVTIHRIISLNITTGEINKVIKEGVLEKIKEAGICM